MELGRNVALTFIDLYKLKQLEAGTKSTKELNRRVVAQTTSQKFQLKQQQQY